MTSFNVVSASDSVRLDGSRRGRASFNATNTTTRQIRGRAHVATIGDSRPEWFSLDGEPQRQFPAGASQKFDVLVELPVEATGRHQFRLDVVGIEVPDEDFGQSLPVTVALAAEPAAPPTSKGYVTTFIGAVAGGLIGTVVGTLPGSILLINLSHQTISTDPNASIGQAIGQILATAVVEALIGVLLFLLGVFLGLWAGPVLGAYVALRVRAHVYVGWTVGVLAIVQPIVSVLMGLVAVLLFKGVKGTGPQWAILIVLGLAAIAIPPWLARGAARMIKVHGL